MPTPSPAARTFALTAAALTAFAANSLLGREALADRTIDAATYTTVRILTGAAVLATLARARGGAAGVRRGGSWRGAVALMAYAAPFSFAYLRLPAGVGALLLFGAVQATMIGVGLRRGHAPRPAEWVGLGVALVGLVGLTAPGASAPDPVGAALMIVAGIAWGAYSLGGRGSAAPLADTAGNFLRAVPIALAVSVAAVGELAVSGRGVALAALSGGVASGVGYAVWYAALPGLTATRAAIVQLLVPVLTAAGGALLLAEAITPRLVVWGGILLAGVALAVLAPRARG